MPAAAKFAKRLDKTPNYTRSKTERLPGEDIIVADYCRRLENVPVKPVRHFRDASISLIIYTMESANVNNATLPKQKPCLVTRSVVTRPRNITVSRNLSGSIIFSSPRSGKYPRPHQEVIQLFAHFCSCSTKMKFRAKMNDGFCMRRFAFTITTLSKLGKQCILCLSKTDLSFVIFEEGVPKRPLAWCTMQQTQFFNDYNIIGVSDEHNEISLQFSPDMFASAVAPLKFPQTMRSLKIKLTNKNSPCLTCEIEMTTQQQYSRTCIHDIPVEVVPWQLWSDLAIPKNLDFDLTIQMPNMKRFKTACERMKTLGTHVTLEASTDGILALKTEKDLATITTYFKELTVESYNQNSDSSDSECYSVKVDYKKVISFLSIEALDPRKILCKILDRKLLFMHVLHENVLLNYLIPGLSS